MTVREDTIVRADGSDGVYGVVEKPDFALIIPFSGDGFYLVEQFRYPIGARFHEFPQGSWEDDSSHDPSELAVGELREETGLLAGSMEHLGHLYEAYGFSNQGFDVFLATDLSQGSPDRGPEEQDMRQQWVTLDGFERMLRDGRIKDAPTVAAYGLLQLHLRST